ncbi:uncharacterized protein VTP21DRAFT_10155 [Calcarisporiella thermophila]|uniref:uncharacterized protein n=1 Tax=Calcarisporiella thermophila TaxID=911321 RepID=UPI00374325FE
MEHTQKKFDEYKIARNIVRNFQAISINFARTLPPPLLLPPASTCPRHRRCRAAAAGGDARDKVKGPPALNASRSRVRKKHAIWAFSRLSASDLACG